MAGIGMIALGLLLGAVTLFVPALYIPCGVVFELICETKNVKELFRAAGVNDTMLLMFFAAGMIVMFIIASITGKDDGFSVNPAGTYGAIVIVSIFTIVGLLMIPATSAFAAAKIFPLLENWTLRISVIAGIPLLLVVLFMFAITGV